MQTKRPPVSGGPARIRWPRGTYMRLKSGNTLRALMEQQGKSFADVGRYAGRDRSFIWQLVDGRRSTCKPEVASRIADLLDVPVGVLFDPKSSPAGSKIVAHRGRTL